MAKEFFGKRATTQLTKLIKTDLDALDKAKQDKVTGTEGQVLIYNSNGELEASDIVKNLVEGLENI
jgi:hypothetical protein